MHYGLWKNSDIINKPIKIINGVINNEQRKQAGKYNLKQKSQTLKIDIMVST